MTIKEACAFLRVPRSSFYRLIEREGLPVLHFGRAVRVSRPHLQAWLAQREEEEGST